MLSPFGPTRALFLFSSSSCRGTSSMSTSRIYSLFHHIHGGVLSIL
jgi:hypothetical protein